MRVGRELAPGLPPVRADEGQLRAVFLNLLRNSREAMPAGGLLTVTTRGAGGRGGGGARHGGGHPRQALARVFEPFFSTKERGTGLGLAFTQQVLAEHGGTLGCEAARAAGSLHRPVARGRRRSGATDGDRGGLTSMRRRGRRWRRGCARRARAPRGPLAVPVASGFCEARRHVLPNGLRVLTVPTPGLHSAMIALYVRTGSRHETAESNGVSHFLEHLFFRGSKAWPDTVAMNAAVESAGGSLNGITARDHGCYYTPIHAGELGTGLTVLGDVIRRPLLREMDVEREIILEEILDEVDGTGRDIDADNLVKRLAFGDHPLAFRNRRHPADHPRPRSAGGAAHHARYYTGTNLVLCVAGPVNEAEVADLAEEHLVLPRGKLSREEAPPPWPDGPVLEHVEHEDAQSELCLAFPLPSRAPRRLPGAPHHPPAARRRPLVAAPLRGGGEARPGLRPPRRHRRLLRRRHVRGGWRLRATQAAARGGQNSCGCWASSRRRRCRRRSSPGCSGATA